MLKIAQSGSLRARGASECSQSLEFRILIVQPDLYHGNLRVPPSLEILLGLTNGFFNHHLATACPSLQVNAGSDSDYLWCSADCLCCRQCMVRRT